MGVRADSGSMVVIRQGRWQRRGEKEKSWWLLLPSCFSWHFRTLVSSLAGRFGPGMRITFWCLVRGSEIEVGEKEFTH